MKTALACPAAGRPRTRLPSLLLVELIDEVGDEAGPAGLMRSATAAAIVAVKVLEEQDVVLEIRIGLELFIASEDGAPSIGTALKELQQTPAQFVADLIQRQHDA